MNVTGSCHCGHIAFEAMINPDDIVICHCTDCQALSGTAFRTTAYTVPGGFTLMRGDVKIYVKQTADSGNPREQGFCPHCGTPIFAAPTGPPPKAYGIRLGSVDQRADLTPTKQEFCGSRLDWMPPLPAINEY